ncbi:MAG TPA: DUF3151 family protein [Actinomycetota bacterium]|nr:DUF3151 family protein [Actinomycetota bacterium]
MTGLPIDEPLEVRLEEPPGALEALASAADAADVAARHPDCLAAWAALGDAALAAGRAVDAYAYFRVGYHRGLDRLRASGWRGSGRVPWSHEPNRGFLASLAGLGRAAGALGESAEQERCAEFLDRLAPDYP